MGICAVVMVVMPMMLVVMGMVVVFAEQLEMFVASRTAQAGLEHPDADCKD